jgi:hypothetical protein
MSLNKEEKELLLDIIHRAVNGSVSDDIDPEEAETTSLYVSASEIAEETKISIQDIVDFAKEKGFAVYEVVGNDSKSDFNDSNYEGEILIANPIVTVDDIKNDYNLFYNLKKDPEIKVIAGGKTDKVKKLSAELLAKLEKQLAVDDVNPLEPEKIDAGLNESLYTQIMNTLNIISDGEDDSSKDKADKVDIKEDKADDDALWTDIVKQYCRKYGYKFLFANWENQDFGYIDKNGNNIHKYANDLTKEFKTVTENKSPSLLDDLGIEIFDLEKSKSDDPKENYSISVDEGSFGHSLEANFLEAKDIASEYGLRVYALKDYDILDEDKLELAHVIYAGKSENVLKYLHDNFDKDEDKHWAEENNIDYKPNEDESLKESDDDLVKVRDAIKGLKFGEEKSIHIGSFWVYTHVTNANFGSHWESKEVSTIQLNQGSDNIALFQDAEDEHEFEIYKQELLTDLDSIVNKDDIKEDVVKQGNSWVNKGKEGTHGKFATKAKADAQRKAMFARGFKESLTEAKENKYVIYKDGNKILGTDSTNYDNHLANELEINDFTSFGSVDKIVNYLVKYGQLKKENIIIKDGLDEKLEDKVTDNIDTTKLAIKQEDKPADKQEPTNKPEEIKPDKLTDKEDIVIDKPTSAKDIDDYIDKLYEMRKTSIAKDGEFGIGNLVFKELRNLGYLDNLKELRNELRSQELSLNPTPEENKKLDTLIKPEVKSVDEAININKYGTKEEIKKLAAKADKDGTYSVDDKGNITPVPFKTGFQVSFFRPEITNDEIKSVLNVIGSKLGEKYFGLWKDGGEISYHIDNEANAYKLAKIFNQETIMDWSKYGTDKQFPNNPDYNKDKKVDYKEAIKQFQDFINNKEPVSAPTDSKEEK